MILRCKNQVTILVNVVVYIFYQGTFHRALVKDFYQDTIAEMLF